MPAAIIGTPVVSAGGFNAINTITFPATTAGSTLFILLYGSPQPATLQTNLGQNFVYDFVTSIGSSFFNLYRLSNVTAGTTSVSSAAVAGTGIDLCAIEVSGLAAASPPYSVSNITGGLGTTNNFSITLPSAGLFLIIDALTFATNITSTTPTTTIVTSSSAFGHRSMAGIFASSGAQTFTTNLSASGNPPADFIGYAQAVANPDYYLQDVVEM